MYSTCIELKKKEREKKNQCAICNLFRIGLTKPYFGLFMTINIRLIFTIILKLATKKGQEERAKKNVRVRSNE